MVFSNLLIQAVFKACIHVVFSGLLFKPFFKSWIDVVFCRLFSLSLYSWIHVIFWRLFSQPFFVNPRGHLEALFHAFFHESMWSFEKLLTKLCILSTHRLSLSLPAVWECRVKSWLTEGQSPERRTKDNPSENGNVIFPPPQFASGAILTNRLPGTQSPFA